MELLGFPLRVGAAKGLLLRTSETNPTARGGILWLPRLREDQIRGLVAQGVRGAITLGRTLATSSRRVEEEFPVVGGLDSELFRADEIARVDGTAGTVTLDAVQEVRVVTSFLEDPEGRILLLRRSDRVASFQGRWAGVSGFLEDPTAEAQARREVQEETGFDGGSLDLRAAAPPLYARDGNRVFVVFPFRFGVLSSEVHLDWEHTEYAWVSPDDITARDTVPRLLEVWRSVAPHRD